MLRETLMVRNASAVLFDLDGTLLDTAPDLGGALNHVLQNKGFPICEYEEYRVTASHGAKGLLDLGFGESIADFEYDELRQMFLDYYETNICQGTSLFPNIKELLHYLDSNEIAWGIVTNKPGYLTEKLLPYFPEFSKCQVVISGDTLKVRKPDPEPLIYAAQSLGVSPDNVWYVGDAERDMQAAKAANMVAVLAMYGYIADTDETHEWDVDHYIDDAIELVK